MDNQQRTNYTSGRLYLYADGEFDNLLFHFCSSDGMHVMCVCLQCGRCKQDHTLTHKWLYGNSWWTHFKPDPNTVDWLQIAV